jgi:hypothetical protein
MKSITNGACPLKPEIQEPAMAHPRARSRSLWPSGCLAISLALAALLAPAVSRAQNYSIDWFKVAGGGGTSTGGVFTVSGTIGQPDAGAMTNGSFTIVGGFWSFVAAVQTEGAPILHVARTVTNTVNVSWLKPADGWILTWTNALAGGTNAWPAIAPALYQTNATEFLYVEPAPVMGSRFYRLRKP